MMVMATTRGNCVPQCKASAARWRIDRSAQQLRRNAVLELCRACSCPAPPRPGLDSRPRPGHHRGCCNGLKLSVTTDRMLTTDDILHAFAKARGVPPLAAVRQAISRWEEVRPYLVARLEAIVATGDRSEAENLSARPRQTPFSGCQRGFVPVVKALWRAGARRSPIAARINRERPLRLGNGPPVQPSAARQPLFLYY